MTRRGVLAVLVGTALLFACNGDLKTQQSIDYDADLARKLGADEYGMKPYVFVTLKTGPNDASITGKDERSALFRGHFANMDRLADEGKLVLAGPLIEAAPKRGIYIFNTPDIEKAREWTRSDPAVAAGIFTFEYDKYYGSAALMHINDLHKRIQKTKIE